MGTVTERVPAGVAGPVVGWGRPDPEIWDEPQMRRVLAARDIPVVYRILNGRGYRQWKIGLLTGQSQPEISPIMHGRTVVAVVVLARIAKGLGIPGRYLGLACCACPHTGPVPGAGECGRGHRGGRREDRWGLRAL